MNSFDHALRALYVERGVMAADGSPVHLPTGCPNAGACWAGEASRMPSAGHAASEMSPPWIGPAYEPGGLLVLLINMNRWGGLSFGPDPQTGNRFLARSARAGFSQGHRVLFADKSYRGTKVWYQAMQYAAVWTEVRHGIPNRSSDGRYLGPDLAKVMDQIALTQHVKCSPISSQPAERSQPTARMWEQCGPHLLQHEIRILRPNAVLVIGASDNLWATQRLFPQAVGSASEEPVRIGRRMSRLVVETRSLPGGEAPADLISVPHPAALGGAAKRLIGSLHSLLSRRRTL